MVSVGSVASSGLTITPFPTQLLVAASLLWDSCCEQCGKLVFSVARKVHTPNPLYITNNSRDDSSYSLHDMSLYDAENLK
jgi:hypothetical protein